MYVENSRSNENYDGIGIVMLTAKSEEIDRIVGFEMGADDYVTKPFSVRELILRVKVLLKKRTDDGANETNTRIWSYFDEFRCP